MQKRYKIKKAKPGQLIAYYGRAGNEGRNEPPDVCTNADDSGDAKLLLFALCDAPTMYSSAPNGGVRKDCWPNQGLLKELEARGYDIETLMFSIEKKPK